MTENQHIDFDSYEEARTEILRRGFTRAPMAPAIEGYSRYRPPGHVDCVSIAGIVGGKVRAQGLFGSSLEALDGEWSGGTRTDLRERQWTCFPTYDVIRNGRAIGVIQHQYAAAGITKARDNGRRLAWKGTGNDEGDYLGAFDNQEKAIAAIQEKTHAKM